MKHVLELEIIYEINKIVGVTCLVQFSVFPFC